MRPSGQKREGATEEGLSPAAPHEADRAGLRSPLLEREEELERIRAVIASARARRGAVVAVEGSPGIGKTRLLEAAMELAAESDVSVMRARGGQMEIEFAFGVARQLFEPVLPAADTSELEVMLDGAAAPARWLFGANRPGEPVGGGDRGFATLHGLYWLTAKLARKTPLLIVIDDVHWADAPSLRFLVYLARRVHELPVALVVAVRPEDPGAHGLMLGELVAASRVDVVRVEALTIDAVRALLQGEFGQTPLHPRFVHGCWTTTGGNPFLLTQLIGALRARGGELTSAAVEQIGEMGLRNVSRWIHLRLARLPPSATALATAVAVLGDGADAELSARLIGLESTGLDVAVDGLISIGILQGGDHLEFVHPLVRAAIYAELPPRARARWHRDAAMMLRRGGVGAERAALHLLAASPAGDGEAVQILIEAAQSATRQGAPDIAVRYLRQALAEPAPDEFMPELLRELGAAEQSAGQFAAAAEDLRRALECTTDVAARIEIGFRLRYALVWSDRSQEVAPALDGVIAQAAGQDPNGALLLEAATAGIFLVDLATPISQRQRLQHLLEQSFGGESVPPHISSLAAVDALYANQPAARVLALAEQAARGWDQTPPFARGLMSAQLFVALIFAEEYSLARRLLDDELDNAQRHGSTAQFLNAASFRSMLFYRLGALVEAEADARAALEAAQLYPGAGQASSGPPAPSLHAPMAVAVLLETLIERWELDDAERVLRQTGLADADSHLLLFAFLMAARARLRAAQGRTKEAIEEFMALGERMRRVRSPALVPWRSLTALAVAGQNPDEAGRLAREELQLARVFGGPRTIGVALHAAALTGAATERLDLLREAVAVLEDSPAGLEHARSLVELGATLRRQGKRSEARSLLERGMDAAQACGATALAQRARDELRAIGARPRRLALTGVDALTGAERRVADLAAQGLTNRQIARALVLSLPTVETHLRHVFQKLGISSRTQLSERVDGSHESPHT